MLFFLTVVNYLEGLSKNLRRGTKMCFKNLGDPDNVAVLFAA